MSKYSQQQLNKRERIIQSQVLFGNFLNSEIINNLVLLFDENNKTNHSIVKYIENERNIEGLNTSNIVIKSKVYGTNKDNTTLILKLFKDNNQILHLTIHLITSNLKPENDGIIHFKKNIYKMSSRKRYKLYSLVSIKQPINKSNSLEFSINEGYNTPSDVPNVQKYDTEIKKEMDIIIKVLNRLFDEKNTEMYIGKKSMIPNIHFKTNNVLNNINKHSKYTVRKNKGTQYINKSSLYESKMNIMYNKTKRRTLRKNHTK
jgi:hypothetical protein